MNSPLTKASVLLLSVHFPPARQAGGPIRSIAGLVERESPYHAITVVTSNRDLVDPEPLELNLTETPICRLGASVHYCEPSSMAAHARRLRRIGNQGFDILHLNSLFSPKFSILPLLMWRIGLIDANRVILAPRGELGSAALRVKRWKKKLALPLVNLLAKHPKVTWQATSDSEARDIQRHGSRRRILRHDNPWPQPANITPPKDEQLHFVFVGRIASIKNPGTVIDSFRGVSSPVRLTFAGVDEDVDLSASLKAAAQTLPQNVDVDFAGHLDSHTLDGLLSRAHALILPTGGENFGHSIAEAFAHGCFVLVPDTTPWTKLILAGGGYEISSEPSATNRSLVAKITTLSRATIGEHCSTALRLYTDLWSQHEGHRRSLYGPPIDSNQRLD